MAVDRATALPKVTLTRGLLLAPTRVARLTVVWNQRGFTSPPVSLPLLNMMRPLPNQATFVTLLNQSGAAYVVTSLLLSLKVSVREPAGFVPLPEWAITAI